MENRGETILVKLRQLRVINVGRFGSPGDNQVGSSLLDSSANTEFTYANK